MVVAPAGPDADEAGFRDVLSVAVDRASETNQLLTLGITDAAGHRVRLHPVRRPPDAEDDRLRQVRTFTEKPDRELAEQFLASGDFCWNAGIFVWSVQTILDRFEDQMPDLHALFEERKADLGTCAEEEAILAIYGAAENISIDYGIMEKAPNVGVVLGDYGWSDLGTWGSLYDTLDKEGDAHANSGATLFTEELQRTDGGGGGPQAHRGQDSNFIVVGADALLICPRDEEQWVKHSCLKAEKGKPLVDPPEMQRTAPGWRGAVDYERSMESQLGPACGSPGRPGSSLDR